VQAIIAVDIDLTIHDDGAITCDYRFPAVRHFWRLGRS
jgi:hypothetical protein